MDFIHTVKTRKSTRRFTSRDVPDELITKILDLATYSPTPCNQQLWKFVVIKDKSVKKRLVREAYSSTILLKAPVVVAVLYDNWNTKEALQAASMSVQNILLASNYYNVGSLAMNSYGAESKIRKILNIPKKYLICCFVCLGYPDKSELKSGPLPRRSCPGIVSYNKLHTTSRISYSYNPENWALQDITEFQKYYCRKTWQGKEMDIRHPLEKQLVSEVLKKGAYVDLLSYDGSYLDCFPGKLTTYDLSEETVNYTKKSAELKSLRDIKFEVYGKSTVLKRAENYTLIYKAERLPKRVLLEMLKKARQGNGSITIISRRNSFLFNIFYRAMKFLFGDDIRKTGIYAFFGPYAPVKPKEIVGFLKKAGFRNITETRYFLIPPFLDQAYQMYLQYKRSEGSSYLHRIRRDSWISRSLSFILEKQGIKKNRLGSVSVFEAE